MNKNSTQRKAGKGNKGYQNLRVVANTILKKIHNLNSYVRKEERLKINYIKVYLDTLGEEGQIKFKINRRKEIIKIRVGII